MAHTSNAINYYFSVSFGAFAVGNVLSWTSVALPYITETNSTKTMEYPRLTLNPDQEALVGALLTVGALVAAIPAGCLADKLGRKKAILATILPLLIHWTMITYLSDARVLFVARLVAGTGVGGFCVVAPMYLAEIADSSCRGVFGSFFQLFICAGILFTCVLGPFTTWISLSMTLAAMPVLFIIALCFLPESPLFLVKSHQIGNAEIVLKRLRGQRYHVKGELNDLQTEIEINQEKKMSLSDVLTVKRYRRSMIAVLGVLLFQQFSGINALIFYSVPIFQAAGAGFSPTIAAIVVNSVQVLATYVSSLIIERAGRKFFLTLSAIGMSICLVVLGLFFHYKPPDDEIGGFVALLPVLSTVVFMTAFSVGFGPIPWMLIGELFAPEIKAVATGVAVLSSWLFAFLVTFFFPIINSRAGIHVTFYIFSIFMLISLFFIRSLIPETRGKSLNEIQKELDK
ncbi:hypothetical protein GWI33_007575 [Rhynchophorus ferrugineus]|uniref:Major facilitator superfamily (MFS) profile domain-containing protein n=1 Tax=Rhynchophorus ferrugineus TaxID=354439 RepID=A0A834MI66_RHYFE|nr:hypothetical protein GWI33_007575 [Rhynchophorus ferrugineus]